MKLSSPAVFIGLAALAIGFAGVTFQKQANPSRPAAGQAHERRSASQLSIREAKSPERPVPIELDPIANLRSQEQRAQVSGISQPTVIQTCDVNSLPLGVDFADYTLDSLGTPIQDGGWSAMEIEEISIFLCRTLPMLESLYGTPYERYTVTVVKDLYYTTSGIFIPSTQTIHLGPNWYPQLLLHEFTHAFRGQWGLTADPASPYNYDSTLSGFEEGFAQAVSYDVINQYLEQYGADSYAGPYIHVPATFVNYDFKNTESMITKSLWSDSGATLTTNERYEMAASAIQMLVFAIPNFYTQFNSLYYARINADPSYRPTRDGIIDILKTISPEIAGQTMEAWIDAQKIFQCRSEYGKKIFVNTASYNFREPQVRIHLVETFPSDSEWVYAVPSVGYLYHRLQGTMGFLNLTQAWNGSAYFAAPISDKPYTFWGSYQACGINCAPGIGGDEFKIYDNDPGNYFIVDNPVTMPSPSEAGLFAGEISFSNPHFSATPEYGISYDQTQTEAVETHYFLAGIGISDYYNSDIFGGIVGANSGQVVIQHSAMPETVTSISVNHGAFTAPAPDEWKFQKSIGNGQTRIAFVPGTLTFTFTPAGSSQHYVTHRIAGYGSNASHIFLLQFEGIEAKGGSSSSSGRRFACGLTGMEALLVWLGMWIFLRGTRKNRLQEQA